MRVQIELPQTWIFQTCLTVRVLDINYGGHLGNDRVLALVHEARVRWLGTLGLREADVGQGAGLIMADAALMFRQEAFLGDELAIALGVSEVRRSSFELVATIKGVADDKEIARVKTGLVCFNYGTRQVTRIPENFLSILRAGL